MPKKKGKHAKSKNAASKADISNVTSNTPSKVTKASEKKAVEDGNQQAQNLSVVQADVLPAFADSVPTCFLLGSTELLTEDSMLALFQMLQEDGSPDEWIATIRRNDFQIVRVFLATPLMKSPVYYDMLNFMRLADQDRASDIADVMCGDDTDVATYIDTLFTYLKNVTSLGIYDQNETELLQEQIAARLITLIHGLLRHVIKRAAPEQIKSALLTAHLSDHMDIILELLPQEHLTQKCGQILMLVNRLTTNTHRQMAEHTHANVAEFGQAVINVINTSVDHVNDAKDANDSLLMCQLALEFVSELFYMKPPVEFFYQNDVVVLVDVLIRCIRNISTRSALFLDALLVVAAVVNSNQYKSTDYHKANEMHEILTGLVADLTPAHPEDLDVIDTDTVQQAGAKEHLAAVLDLCALTAKDLLSKL